MTEEREWEEMIHVSFVATSFFLLLPFMRGGLCKLAWLAEQLQMWDTIHTAIFQSIESSEFKTFIFINYGNHMPQICPVKSRGKAFHCSLSKFSIGLPREAGRRNNTWITHRWEKRGVFNYQGWKKHPLCATLFQSNFEKLQYRC